MANEIGLAKRSELHLKRRLWHVLVGCLGLVCYYQLSLELYIYGYFSVLVALLGFWIDFKRLGNPNLNNFLEKHFGPVMRRSEKLSFSGLPFYALGVAIAIFVYDEKIAILSILFLIFADPIASIVGVYMGRDRLLPNKTLQGTMAAFSVCLVTILGYLYVLEVESQNIIIFAFFGAICGALSELISAFNIDDNLTIPVLSGGALTLFNLWFGVL